MGQGGFPHSGTRLIVPESNSLARRRLRREYDMISGYGQELLCCWCGRLTRRESLWRQTANLLSIIGVSQCPLLEGGNNWSNGDLTPFFLSLVKRRLDPFLSSPFFLSLSHKMRRSGLSHEGFIRLYGVKWHAQIKGVISWPKTAF